MGWVALCTTCIVWCVFKCTLFAVIIILIIKFTKKMKEENEDEATWTLEIGLYPGILLGFRTYEQKGHIMHVLYFPFVEFGLSIYK